VLGDEPQGLDHECLLPSLRDAIQDPALEKVWRGACDLLRLCELFKKEYTRFKEGLKSVSENLHAIL
jgi:hypothetical protein